MADQFACLKPLDWDGLVTEVQSLVPSEIAAERLRRIAELYRIKAEIRGMGPILPLNAGIESARCIATKSEVFNKISREALLGMKCCPRLPMAALATAAVRWRIMTNVCKGPSTKTANLLF